MHLLVSEAEDNDPTDASMLSSKRRPLQSFPGYVFLFVLSLHHLLVFISSLGQGWDVLEQARWGRRKILHGIAMRVRVISSRLCGLFCNCIAKIFGEEPYVWSKGILLIRSVSTLMPLLGLMRFNGEHMPYVAWRRACNGGLWLFHFSGGIE